MDRTAKTKFRIAIVMAVLMIMGMIMIFTATNAGLRAGSAAIDAAGGSMDTDKYYMIMEFSTWEALIGGGVMALLGGGGFLISLKSMLDDFSRK